MALPVDFMARVVAWPGLAGPGYVNLHWTVPPVRGHGVRGRPFKEVHDFMNDVATMAASPGMYKEVYFCLSTQRDTGGVTKYGKIKAHRHATKALALKSIWIDIDCGHGKDYATQADALVALTKFVDDASLPAPTAIVNSGGGIHAYWISDTPLTVDQWRPYAEGLKAEALRLKLCKDTGIIADCARILRVPGTFNNKIAGMPRVVKLLHLAPEDYSFAGMPKLARLATLVKVTKAPQSVTAAVTQAFTLPDAFKVGAASAFAVLDAAGDKLNAGIERKDLSLPLLVDQAIVKCQHFRDCATTHGALHGQGLWALTLLACTFLDDGERWAHNFSKGYPTYDAGETDAKFAEKQKYKAENNLGWPSCSAFEGEGAKCAGCPFKGTISSPLALCDRQDPPAPPPVNFAQAAVEEALDLPEGFTVNERGYICEIIEKIDPKSQASSTEYMPLFLCQLRNFHAQSGIRMMLFETSLDKGHWEEVKIRETEDLINETTIIKALRQYGVKPNTNWVQAPRRIIHFMTSFMEKLDIERERQKAIPFGWLWSDRVVSELPIGFAYGGRVCMNDGSQRPASYSDPQLENFYKPTGSDELWWDLFHMVTAQHHPGLECIIASSFAAPLMTATGLYNGVVHAWSPDSGARKSTSMQIGAAIWGKPKLTKERPSASQKGILKKLGIIKSLPLFWDEINSQEKIDQVQAILGDLTEGATGTKLTSGRDVTAYDEWQTCMLVGANKSLIDNIIRKVKDTDAQLQRVFEYTVEKRAAPGVGTDVDVQLASLDRNYGHMGLLYSKYLGDNIELVFKLVRDVRVKFAAEVGAEDQERFRAGLAAAIYSGAVIANEIGCDFNLNELWQFLVDRFREQKHKITNAAIVAGTPDNTATALSQFFKHHVKNTLWIQGLPARRRGPPDAVVYVAGPRKEYPQEIHVRFSISDRVVDISKAALSKYLDWQKHNPQAVMDGLVRHFGAEVIQKINLAVGSGINGGQEAVYRVPIPDNSPWVADMWAHTALDQRVTAPVTTGMEAAAAQAAADLATVRAAS